MRSHLAVFVFCALSYGYIADACMNSMPAASSACSSGGKGAQCGGICTCDSARSLSCVEETCQCAANSQGSFAHFCNIDCPCQAVLGLMCSSGQCVCNKTSSLWDTDKCVKIETDLTLCEALVMQSEAKKKRELIVGKASAFNADASKEAWKCVAATRMLYSPTYDQVTGRNKYYVGSTWIMSPESYKKCFGMRMSRVMPSPGDEFEIMLKTMNNPWFWAGAKRNNGDGKFYWDDGREFNQDLRTTDSGDCVELIYDNSDLYYNSADCSNYFAQAACVSL